MSIYLFCEGQTEKNVVEQFVALKNPEFKGEGKKEVNKKMAGTLEPLLNQQVTPLRVLVMRDVDKDEKPASIIQSVTDAVQRMLTKRDFSASVIFVAHNQYPNVYELTLTEPNLRIALHLATDKWDAGFINATIDDYVLALALREATAQAFIDGKKWDTKPERIIRKVTNRIPTLLQENGIPLREAKDYVSLYAAIIQVHKSPTIFAGKTLANATDADKQAVFAPLLAALDFLGAELK